MRSRGGRITLDDFGSGLSSLAYLENLSVDIPEIDAVFIRDLASNTIDPIPVRSMCEVAHSLGKITVAERVEDRRQLTLLRKLDVDQAQGHGIHEPCALIDIISEQVSRDERVGSWPDVLISRGKPRRAVSRVRC